VYGAPCKNYENTVGNLWCVLLPQYGIHRAHADAFLCHAATAGRALCGLCARALCAHTVRTRAVRDLWIYATDTGFSTRTRAAAARVVRDLWIYATDTGFSTRTRAAARAVRTRAARTRAVRATTTSSETTGGKRTYASADCDRARGAKLGRGDGTGEEHGDDE
jgi:hypothetical protein